MPLRSPTLFLIAVVICTISMQDAADRLGVGARIWVRYGCVVLFLRLGSGLVLVAPGTWVVKDDLGMRISGLVVRDDYAAEHEAEGIGDDGCTAWRDAALGDQLDHIGEQGVDVFRGPVAAVVYDQDFLGEIGGVLQFVRRGFAVSGVTGAKVGGRVLRIEAALLEVATASAAALAALGRVVCR